MAKAMAIFETLCRSGADIRKVRVEIGHRVLLLLLLIVFALLFGYVEKICKKALHAGYNSLPKVLGVSLLL